MMRLVYFMQIGYGRIEPQTTNGRLFTVIYGFIGVPFTVIIFSNFGRYLQKLEQWLRRRYCIAPRRRLLRRLSNFSGVVAGGNFLVGGDTITSINNDYGPPPEIITAKVDGGTNIRETYITRRPFEAAQSGSRRRSTFAADGSPVIMIDDGNDDRAEHVVIDGVELVGALEDSDQCSPWTLIAIVLLYLVGRFLLPNLEGGAYRMHFLLRLYGFLVVSLPSFTSREEISR